MVEGPIDARISGSWSRCSLVSDGTERSDTSSGSMTRAPYWASAFRARSWIGSRGVPQIGVVFPPRPLPLRQGGEDLLQQDQGEDPLNPGQQRGARPRGWTDVRGP